MLLSNIPKHDFLVFFRKMSKKGFYEVFNYIHEKKSVHYNEVLKHVLDKKIVDSRASVTIILNGLTNLGLLERTVIDTRPIRTSYQISKSGYHIIKNLKELESVFSK
jgi:DNA-binding HxlR family transcriptional regulator